MGVLLELELDGTKISRELVTVTEGIKDLKKPFDEAGSTFLKTFDMNFASRGGEYGGWPARKRSYEWPILERSGRMRHAFRKRVTGDELILDNQASYFKYHQSSAPRKSALPRRILMMLRRQDATMVQKTVQRYLIEVLRNRGLR